jgi:hypothetical protein
MTVSLLVACTVCLGGISMLKRYRSLLIIAAVIIAAAFLGMWPRQQTTQAVEPIGPASVNWRFLSQGPEDADTYRAEVPGGWLICVHETKEETSRTQQAIRRGIGIGAGVTFVPDPKHEWK